MGPSAGNWLVIPGEGWRFTVLFNFFWSLYFPNKKLGGAGGGFETLFQLLCLPGGCAGTWVPGATQIPTCWCGSLPRLSVPGGSQSKKGSFSLRVERNHQHPGDSSECLGLEQLAHET